MATRRRAANLDRADFDQLQHELSELRSMRSQNEGMERMLQWQATYGERIDNVLVSLQELKESTKATKEDHHKRISDLEKWQNEAKGERNILVIIAGIVGATITWVVEHMSK